MKGQQQEPEVQAVAAVSWLARCHTFWSTSRWYFFVYTLSTSLHMKYFQRSANLAGSMAPFPGFQETVRFSSSQIRDQHPDIFGHFVVKNTPVLSGDLIGNSLSGGSSSRCPPDFCFEDVSAYSLGPSPLLLVWTTQTCCVRHNWHLFYLQGQILLHCATYSRTLVAPPRASDFLHLPVSMVAYLPFRDARSYKRFLTLSVPPPGYRWVCNSMQQGKVTNAPGRAVAPS